MSKDEKWADKKQKINENVETPVKVKIKIYSKAKPDAPVTSIPSISLKRNQYQDDIFTAAAKKMKVSKQQFIRLACLKYAEQMGIY